jgi:uncharacterized membrane protein
MDATMRVAEIPAARGASWITKSFSLFRAQPMAWIGLCMGWLLIWFSTLLVPLLGPILATMLQPVFFASFAIAAFKQTAGERITMADLFTGFRRNMRPLLNIGIIMVMAQLASIFLMKALGLPAWPADQQVELATYAEMVRSNKWIIFGGLLFMAVVSGALWFAPQLIVFHDMTTSHAIRWSVYAAIANLGAMIVYGVALLALFIAAWIPFGLGLVIVLPLMVISTFVGYREVFEAK